MDQLVSELSTQLGTWSAPEVAAVLLAILYLLLAIRENIWCWLCAGASTAIYIYLYADAKLYMESVLNLFYFAMAIYGWSVWRSGSGDDRKIAVITMPWNVHAFAAAAIFVLAWTTGSLLDSYTDAELPYLDSAIMYSSMWATYLVARKVLENWGYWLVIDAVTAYVNGSRGLELTALLYGLYLVMIPFGWYRWTRSWRARQAAIAT